MIRACFVPAKSQEGEQRKSQACRSADGDCGQMRLVAVHQHTLLLFSCKLSMRFPLAGKTGEKSVGTPTWPLSFIRISTGPLLHNTSGSLYIAISGTCLFEMGKFPSSLCKAFSRRDIGPSRAIASAAMALRMASENNQV